MDPVEVERLANAIGANALALFALLAGVLALLLLALVVVGREVGRRRYAIRRRVRLVWDRAAAPGVRRFPALGAVLRRVTPSRYLIVHLALGLVLTLALAFFFMLAQAVAASGAVVQFDTALAAALDRSATFQGTRIFEVVTAFGSGRVLAPFGALVAVGLLLRGRRLLCLGWIVALSGSGILNWALKELYRRTRPEIADPLLRAGSWSFPSGHAMATIVAVGMLAYLLVVSERRLEAKIATLVFALLWVLVIGFSRLYVGAHYLSDVLAGYLAGTVWLAVCISGLEIARRHRRRQVRRKQAGPAEEPAGDEV